MSLSTKNRVSPFQFWDENIKIFPSGVSRRRVVGRVFDSPRVSLSLRGRITYFSRHSALRLRRALVELAPVDSSGYVQLGLTVTVPWNVFGYSDERIIDDYKIAFNRFSVAFRRRFPNSLAIFRHELQKRRAPHSHFVLWLSSVDFEFVARGRSSTSGLFRALILGMWSKAVLGSDCSSSFVYPVKSLTGFNRRGIKIDLLSDSLSMFRYIADHASKHKKSQLGYKGKQWGFINKKLFVPSKSFHVKFANENQYISFFRHVSKVSRYMIDSGKSSQRLSKRSSGKSVIFVPDRVSIPLCDSIVIGRVCLQGELPSYVFIRLWFPLLRCLFEVAYIQYFVGFVLLRLFSRPFVICSLMPHILLCEKSNC